MDLVKKLAVPLSALMLLGLNGCGNRSADKNAVFNGQPVSGGTLIFATDREPTC